MTFEYSDYYAGLVGRPLLAVGIAILVLLGSLVLYILFDKITRIIKLRFEKGKLVLIIFPCIVLLMLGFGTINYNFLFDDESDLYKIEGMITDISEVGRSPKYTYDGMPVTPKYLTIDDQKYYVMYIGDFEIGDIVKLDYLPKSKTVLTIELIPTDLE